MRIFRVIHEDVMGGTITEEFYDSKNKAKKALKKMFKQLKSNMVAEDDINYLSEHLVHAKQNFINSEKSRCYELMFEMWHKCNYEYDEWDTHVESLHIDLIDVN